MAKKSDNRLKLEAKANELEIIFSDDVSDRDLAKLITEAQNGAGGNPPPIDSNDKSKTASAYGFCKVPGGVRIDIIVNGAKKTVLLKSASKKSLAGDEQTLKFDINAKEYGIVELSKQEAGLCVKAIENTKMFKKGFVFFADNKSDGQKKAAQFSALHGKTGFEQLSMEEVEKAVEKFSGE
ncbi:MAG: hypothetical protein LBV16_06340 [Elusimicrobiota bacterium]|jgi:hypothetical protein|nr:hypothetical protein [Elusimicrobiota bacterium]